MSMNFFTDKLPSFLLASGDNLADFLIHHVTDSNRWHPLPLLDFEVHFPSFELFNIVFTNGLHALMVLIAAMIIIFAFTILFRKDSDKAPKGLTNALEILVLFIRDQICIQYLGEKDGKKFAPFFLTLFFFILTLNFMGLIPIFSTATSNVNVTAALSLVILTIMVVFGVGRNGLFGFFKLFVPPGVPALIVPLIFTLEFAGLAIKPFALTLRLFANMLAGHVIILAITGVVVGFGLTGLPLLLLTLFVYFLEILVAFLQAYIFVLLSSIFISEMLHPHH